MPIGSFFQRCQLQSAQWLWSSTTPSASWPLLSFFLGLTVLWCAGTVQAVQAQSGVWILPGTTPTVVSTTTPMTEPDAGPPVPAWAMPSPRPIAELFRGQTVVASGFSGHVQRRPILPVGAPRPDALSPEYRFINLDGAATTLTALPVDGFGPTAQELGVRPYDTIYAHDVGQIFGIALDSDASEPNLYLAATSAYGLPIVTADANGDRLPDRQHRGLTGAQWMEGLFGPGGGPGTIWRVDGLTGQIARFADIRLDGHENAGPGLGNLAWDSTFSVLHVSDLETGMIFRVSQTGAVLEHFDHGVDGRAAESLPPVPFDAALRMDRTRPDFDADAPQTWGYAPPERRVWGLAVHLGRLYYGVAQGRADRPEVWSVGLDARTGTYLRDARWEITLPDDVPRFEISDIAFTSGALMLLAQRADRRAGFDFVTFAEPQQAGVFGYAMLPMSEQTPVDRWQQVPVRFDIGFAGHGDNANGGLALGPGHDATGQPIQGGCQSGLWATGEALRLSVEHALALAPGGEALVDGLQFQPLVFDRRLNSPPWASEFIDYDGHSPTQTAAGPMGDVEVLGCQGEPSTGDDVWLPDPPDDQSLCLSDPRFCPPPPPQMCANVRAQIQCNATTGALEMQLDYGQSQPEGFDQVMVSDPAGILGGLPQTHPTQSPFAVTLGALAPGQLGTLQLCAYNSQDATSGKPYDCCTLTVPWQAPATQCQQEAN